MESSVSLIFKKKNKSDYMFHNISKEEEDPKTIYIIADNNGEDQYLYFDMETLKELHLLISEFLLKGEAISIALRTGDFGMRGPKVEMEDASIDLCDDEVITYFADSLDAENTGQIFIIENKKGQKVTLQPNIKQCKDISKTLRRFIFGYELMHKSHEKRPLKAVTV